MLHELGLLDKASPVPYRRIHQAGGVYADFPFTGADFRHLPAH